MGQVAHVRPLDGDARVYAEEDPVLCTVIVFRVQGRSISVRSTGHFGGRARVCFSQW